MIGDARFIAEELFSMIKDRNPQSKYFHQESVLNDIAAFDLANDFDDASSEELLDPRKIGLKLNNLLPKNANLIFDVGNFVSMLPFLKTLGPNHCKSPRISTP